jgi:hypothetical protein
MYPASVNVVRECSVTYTATMGTTAVLRIASILYESDRRQRRQQQAHQSTIPELRPTPSEMASAKRVEVTTQPGYGPRSTDFGEAEAAADLHSSATKRTKLLPSPVSSSSSASSSSPPPSPTTSPGVLFSARSLFRYDLDRRDVPM